MSTEEVPDLNKYLFGNNAVLNISSLNFITITDQLQFNNSGNFVILFDLIERDKYKQLIAKLAPSVPNWYFGVCSDKEILEKYKINESMIVLFQKGNMIKKYKGEANEFQILKFILF